MDIVSIQSGQNTVTQREPSAREASQSTDMQQGLQSREAGAAGATLAQTAPVEISQALSKEAQGRQEDADNSERSKDENLSEMVEQVQSFFRGQNRNLTFAIDDETQRSVVTVKDSDSGDVIRQIPSEELLQLAEYIRAFQKDIDGRVGVFVNNQV
ncbi:flagellar protein FlaG [Alteromonas halophila]|uniref:Flagellar protein FlaG n=1 Tax=Alteromonas halophila TaxID=516698 RepID=A0A918JEA6_9ALTE|nr:flagellar protein FlaG [Alteromonas halophila]GGW73457.1 hypothetical protein GCM10007391_01390 [Alteromonas halophila]